MKNFIVAIVLLIIGSSPALSQVRVTVDSSCNWTTASPSGQVISTSPTLQDGINFAQTNGVGFVADGNLNCPLSAPIMFGPAIHSSYRIHDVVLNNATVTFDALSGSFLEWTGSINYTGTAQSIVTFHPITQLSNENAPAIQYAHISMPPITVTGGSPTFAVYFVPTSGNIINSKFYFPVVDGGCFANRGIFITNPTPASLALNAFVQNEIDFGLIVGYLTHGLLEGSGQINPNTQPLGTNVYRGAIANGCNNVYAAFQTFGIQGQAYFSSISIDSGSQLYGVFMGPGATGWYVEAPQIQAVQTIVPGTGNRIQSP